VTGRPIDGSCALAVLVDRPETEIFNLFPDKPDACYKLHWQTTRRKIYAMKKESFFSFAERVYLVAVVLGATETMTGCSWGKITDDVTGQPVGHAMVAFEKWDVSQKLEYHDGSALPNNYIPSFSPGPTSTTWDNADPGANGYPGYWSLNPYAQSNNDPKNVLVVEGWSRVEFSRQGYESQIIYQNHLYHAGQVYTHNRYSSGPFPVDTTTTRNDGTLVSYVENRMHPLTQTVRHRSPDIIIDPRTLLDCSISEIAGVPPAGPNVPVTDCEGATNPDTGQPVQRCLRYSVGTANVGEGDLWVKGIMGGAVTQYVYTNPYPDSTTTASIPVPGAAILYHPAHMHFHFQYWTKTRLRKITSACPSDSTATNCPTVWTNDAFKTSFCLEDYRFDPNNPSSTTFDSHYQARKYFPNTCNLEQGIGAGRMDTYRRVLPGQMIDITGLASGNYWLEVEVNPNHAVEESDYTNNISRVVIAIPAVGSDPASWQCVKEVLP